MDHFDLADAGILIGSIGLMIGVYGLYQKFQMDKLGRRITEEEAAMNAADQPQATPASTPR